MIKYQIPDSNQFISFPESVVNKLISYIQLQGETERGGLLFARFKFPEVCISNISLPYRHDIQGIYSFIPNQRHQNIEIFRNYKNGLHFVGEWHTHPQSHPVPSCIDLLSMKDSYLKSRHELNYFLLLILGNTCDFNLTWLSIHNSKTYLKLERMK